MGVCAAHLTNLADEWDLAALVGPGPLWRSGGEVRTGRGGRRPNARGGDRAGGKGERKRGRRNG